MRLKSLEIKGFKSFADKTVVTFDEGITGIIGPNGCGKSNIIDSIRWVIGEQKISALRSENLDALVFNGSKTRSASGLAEVSLTFENTKKVYNKAADKVNTVSFTDYKTYTFEDGQTTTVTKGQPVNAKDKIAEGEFTNNVFYKTIGRTLLLCLFVFLAVMVYAAFIKRRKEGRVHS